MDRRAFLKTGAASTVVAGLARASRTLGAPTADAAKWRAFEVTARAEVLNPTGVTRAWLPLPLMPDTDYHKSQGQSWTGNAAATRIYRDPVYGAAIFYAEWPAGESNPLVEVTSRFATRDRAVDFRDPVNVMREDEHTLAKYLRSTRLIRTDGIVRQTALEITKGAKRDLDRVRAVYEWIVDNTFRDPTVRGCGVGDISWMLETGNLGGKCADLNALFVGLVRAAGVPARDIYGVRVADSAEFKSLGKSGDITRAQHCRAEFYLPTNGWVPVDPADVRKVVLEERGGLALGDPIVKRARAKLFGAWEMNYLAYNYSHDIKLPNSSGDPIAFFMYPQAETSGERRDSLDPDAFRYRLTSRELGA
jgi:transglutaminase-like putative cysteine protease